MHIILHALFLFVVAQLYVSLHWL